MKSRKPIERLLKAFAIMLLVLTIGHAQTQNISTAITHVTLVDVIAGISKPDMTVVITGNRITQIGLTTEIAIPANAHKVDGQGKFLIPGLWDMHIHLGNATEAALTMLVASGITGVRDMGSPRFETLRRWNVEALAGMRIGPRIVAAGPILDDGAPDPTRLIVHNEDEARRAVDYLAETGVDFIKVHEHLDRNTYFAIADEARKLNIPFAGHVPTGENGYLVSGIEASNAGQKCLEHLFGIPFPFQRDTPQSELFATLRKNGTWVDPTLLTIWSRAHVFELAAKQDPRLKHVAPALKQFWDAQVRGFSSNVSVNAKIFEWRAADVKALYDANVPLLAGTDLGFAYVYPGDVGQELELLVRVGLPALDALRTATINPARYLNKEKDLGSVEIGKIADLVLLDGNPLSDIHNVKLVRAVVLNGRFLDHTQLEAMLPTF